LNVVIYLRFIVRNIDVVDTMVISCCVPGQSLIALMYRKNMTSVSQQGKTTSTSLLLVNYVIVVIVVHCVVTMPSQAACVVMMIRYVVVQRSFRSWQ